ncbi:hypothetical protein QOZ91_002678 [Clostridium sardiniense]|nr:hypothetical protein [Clostridium sardiniense]
MREKYVIAYLRDSGLKDITKKDALKLTHINIILMQLK